MKLIQRQIKPNDSIIEIIINPENPYFSVRKVTVNYPNPTNKIGDLAKIKQTAFISSSEITSYDVKVSNNFGMSSENIEKHFPPLTDPSIHKVTLELLHFDPDDELSFDFEIQLGRDLLEMKKPWQEFKTHISNPANTKIFFSAPFGQGKTTFLNEFFKQENETYEVFRIFPVNYSVASNQDIFRYIKSDILFQLLVDKKCEFEQLDNTFLDLIPEVLKKHPEKFLAPVLHFISDVAKNRFEFLLDIHKLWNCFSKEYKEKNISDSKVTSDFFEKILEEEGSIFEDNVITQIIRQQIKYISRTKKSILVIDDLDRLDPDHTFRILNIISAHYDIYENSHSTDYNKFGFDKIIVVCDIENVRNIFEHRYGTRANFSGYINKFYSTSHFLYDNKKVMYQLLNGLVDTQPRNGGPEIFRRPLKRVLLNLIACEELSLRDLMNLQKISFKDVILYHDSIHISDRSNYFRGIYTHVVGYLRKIFTHEMLISKIQRCKQVKAWVAEDDSNECSWNLLASLALVFDSDPNLGYHYIYKKENYSLKLERDHYSNSMRVKSGQNESGSIDLVENKFVKDDFYDLLIECIHLYEELITSWKTNQN